MIALPGGGMMQQPCPHCGAYVRAGAKFCGTCGQAISAPTALPTSAAPPPLAALAMTPSAAYLLAADGQRYPLTGPVTRIGRSSQCSLQLTDQSVSGIHAEIEMRGGKFILRDLGSTNGTFLNNIEVRGPVPLNPGDHVAFGHAVFTFQSGAPALQGLKPAQPLAPAQPAAPPAPAPMAQPFPAQIPQPGPQPIPASAPDWGKRSPQLEGRILHMDGPHQEKLSMIGPMAVTGCLALLFTGCLAPLAPLAFLPMFGRREVTVYYLRIQETQSGATRAAKIRGDTSTQISQGDTVALWGRWDGGTLLVKKAYNYNTNAYLKVK